MAWDPEDITIKDINIFILSSSKGLAEPTRSRRNPTIQFIHGSVREFLLRESGSILQVDMGLASAGLVHDLLKQPCQRYLVSIPSDDIEGFSSDNDIKFPFLKYSIHHIFKHAVSAGNLRRPQEGFLEDFPLATWIALHDSTERSRIRRYDTDTSLLYILTVKNLSHLFRIEVCRSQAINARGGRYDFPVIAAAALGDRAMLELLFSYGADLTVVGSEYRSALHAAIDKSNAPNVGYLIEIGAVPDPLSKEFSTLVRLAVSKGGKWIVEALLTDLEVPETLLRGFEDLAIAALEHEDLKLLGLLLRFGVCTQKHLVEAIVLGKNDAIPVILDHYPFLRGLLGLESHGRVIPLCAAVHFENQPEFLVRRLLECGADPNQSSQDPPGLPLHKGLSSGRTGIVRLLLDYGADAETPFLIHPNAFHALDSCLDQEKRAACQQLLRERNLIPPQDF